MGGADAGCWWQPRPALRLYVCDLVEDELFRQRRSGSGGRPPQPWPDELEFDQDLGIDSLERLALATALAESQLPVTASGKPSDWSIEAEQAAPVDRRH